MKHLTRTGPFAGLPICGNLVGMNEQGNMHAVYAPLDNADIRKEVCPACLGAWIASFDADEALPSWAAEIKEFKLERQSPAELRSIVEGRARVLAEEAKQIALAMRKAEADAMLDSFTLTGSNRPADDPHQQHLF